MGTSDLPRILQQRGRLQRVPRPFRPGVQLAADWVKGLGAALDRHFGTVTHEVLTAGTRTLYHCRPNTP